MARVVRRLLCLLLLADLLVTARFASADVVIHEVHYHPLERAPERDAPHEFIELFASGPAAVDLSGWRFDRGVEFVFPAGTRLEAGELLVVAEDPEELAAFYGLDPSRVLGPFGEGSRLSNSGECVRLVDAAGALRDEVCYADHGTWPVAADGLGATLQRIDAAAPSAEAGNWRAVAIPEERPEPGGGDGGWQTFRVRGVHDGSRFYVYLLGAGEILLDDVQLRRVEGDTELDFIANGGFDGGLDGWDLTGNHASSEVLREGGYGDGGPCLLLRADDAGTGAEGLRQRLTVRPAEEERLELTLRVRYVSGSSTFVVRSSSAREGDAEALRLSADAATGKDVGKSGTPLSANDVGGPGTAATIRLEERSPAWPTPSDTVAIVARVEGNADVAEVACLWRADGAGDGEAPLRDDGRGADATAGDGLFSGVLPPAAGGTLVWFSLRAETRAGLLTFWPRRGSPSHVSGYYVTDARPDTGAGMRLFHIFTPGALRDLSCADGAYRSGTFVDDSGRAYANVGVKFRGETACNYPKKPLRVRFNKGDRFEGQARLNFMAGWNDKSMLREKVGFDLFREAGVAHSEAHFARVHTNGGGFHGVFITVEDPNEDYLERNRRDPDGALYKSRSAMLNADTSRYEPRNAAAYERLDEVREFATQLNRLRDRELIGFLDARLDVESFIDYQALQVITIDGDSVVKNWLLYLGRHQLAGPGDDLVTAFPWDIDLSFGQMLLTTDVRNYDIHPMFQTRSFPFHDQGYHGIITALLETAPDDYYVKAYYGRMWQILQEKFHPDRLIPKVDRYDDATIADVREDLERWPRWGREGRNPDFWREDFREFIRRRFEFLTEFLLSENRTTRGRTFRYTPAPRVKVTEIHYNPPGEDDLEFVELHNLEAAPVDLSGWHLPLLEHRFPAGAAIAAAETVLVARDPAAVRALPDLPAGLQVFGPFSGRLRNEGAVLRLRDDGEGGRYYPETIDVVVYDDEGEWPAGADGEGASLELTARDLDNDEPTSWRAGWSPGRVFPAAGGGGARFVRGDANGDGVLTVADAAATLGYLFAGAALGCADAADFDDGGAVNVSDAIGLLAYLFRGGGSPPDPGAESCGEDPTPDRLPACETPVSCGGV